MTKRPKKSPPPILLELDGEARGKLNKLFDDYGILRPSPLFSILVASDPWTQLAIALAHEHVPGLKPRNTGGAPAKWDIERKFTLYIDVLLRKYRDGDTIAAICRALAEEEPWRTITRHSSDPGPLLYKHFNTICRNEPKLVAAVRDIVEKNPDDFVSSLENLSAGVRRIIVSKL